MRRELDKEERTFHVTSGSSFLTVCSMDWTGREDFPIDTYIELLQYACPLELHWIATNTERFENIMRGEYDNDFPKKWSFIKLRLDSFILADDSFLKKSYDAANTLPDATHPPLPERVRKRV